MILIVLEVKALLVRIMATIKFLCLNSLSSFTHLLNISLDIRGSINRATLGRLLRITHHCMLGWCLYFHVDRNCSIGRGEIIDAALLSKKALISFLENEIKDAKEKGVLFSVHLKATMMKVSDPIIFGHVVKTFLKPVFDKHHRQQTEYCFQPH